LTKQKGVGVPFLQTAIFPDGFPYVIAPAFSTPAFSAPPPNRRNFRIFRAIGLEEHDGDVSIMKSFIQTYYKFIAKSQSEKRLN